jgi:glycosyltransferase involved in cell wall biosynthesis
MTSQNPKISVIIPSFNKVKYIGKTLKSIFDQKYPNLEVIIEDGGSTDGTTRVIKEFAERYPIIWESKKDKGQSDAVNIGLKKATGEILTFINADDSYLTGSFNTVSEACIKNPNALWFAGRGMVVNGDGKEIAQAVTWYKNLFLFLNRKSLILILNYLMQPSVFFTKQAYREFGPFEGNKNYILEYDFWLKLAKKSMPVVIDSILSAFRISGNNISSVNYKKLLADDQKIVGKYTKNPLIILLHKLNNLGRVMSINLINK